MGKPYVVLDTAPAVPFSPFHALSMAVGDRGGGVLARAWDGQADAQAEQGHGELDDQRPSEQDATLVPGHSADAHLAAFVAGVDAEVRAWARGPAAPAAQWDGSATSLDLLAQQVVDRKVSVADPMEDPYLSGASRYLGRTLQQLYGGGWQRGQGAKDPMSPYAGRCYLVRLTDEGERISVSPEYLVEVAAEEGDSSIITDGAGTYAP